MGLGGKNGVEITFRVILPLDLWEYNEKSSLHLRFSHPQLGFWIHNVGEFKSLR